MSPEKDKSSPEPDYLAQGPFSIPGRNWLLLLLLWGLLLLKYAVILGTTLPWYGYLLGSIFFLVFPVVVGRLAWSWKGERPYWGDNVLIASGGILFILLSIPAYALGLAG